LGEKRQGTNRKRKGIKTEGVRAGGGNPLTMVREKKEAQGLLFRFTGKRKTNHWGEGGKKRARNVQ